MKYLKPYKIINESFNIKGLDTHISEIKNLDKIIHSKEWELNQEKKKRSDLSEKLSTDFNVSKMLESIFDKVHVDTQGNNIFHSLINKDKELGGHIEEFFNDFYITFLDRNSNENAGNIEDIYDIHGWQFEITDIHEQQKELDFEDMKNVLEQYDLLKALMRSPYIIGLFNNKLFNKINEE